MSVNVEEIMQQIRAEILAQRQSQLNGDAPQPRLRSNQLAPEFYEHLYQATMLYDQMQVTLHVQKSAVPIFGPLINRLRTAVHMLVLFYVQQLAAKQMAFSKQMLAALNSLSNEMEELLEEKQNPPSD